MCIPIMIASSYIHCMSSRSLGSLVFPVSVFSSPCMSLHIQRPMGLLALLDEESKFPRASDLSLAGRLSS